MFGKFLCSICCNKITLFSNLVVKTRYISQRDKSLLTENKKYNNAYRGYLRELITLVIILIEMVMENRIRSDIFIKQYYKFSFSASTISHIKKEVKSLFSSI